MKIRHIGYPTTGPRGGLVMMGSATITSDDGGVALQVLANIRGKWSKEHEDLFREFAAKLSNSIEHTEDFKESRKL